MLPIQDVLIYSLILSFVLALLYRLLTNPKEMRKIKEEMKFYREKSSKAQKSGDKEKMNQYTTEMLKASQKQFKSTMKPLFASMIIFFIALGWLGSAYVELAINVPFHIPFIGNTLNWFWWYIVITIPSTQIFRKLLGVE